MTSPEQELDPTAPWRLWLRKIGKSFGTALNPFGVWLMSVLGTLGLPCLPLLVERLRDSQIKNDSYFLTAAVLAASFIFTADHYVFRAIYILLFLINLLLDIVPGDTTKDLAHWSGSLLVGVALLHATERFWWHIIWDRPFPDTKG